MWRTSLTGASLAAMAWLCASTLTEGFEVWTAEGARRLQVANAPAPAPHAVLASSGMNLHDVLARHVTIASFIYTRCACSKASANAAAVLSPDLRTSAGDATLGGDV